MINFSIVYNRKHKLRKNGTALIQIKAYLNNKAKYFSTNIYVTPRQWSPRRKQVVDHPNSMAFNNEIRRQIDRMETYALELMKKQGSVTLQQLDNTTRYEDLNSFTEFFEYEMTNSSTLANETKKKQKTALNYLKKFRKKILFADLTYDLILEYDRFLSSHGLHINTIYTHHKQVRRYINVAIKRDIFDANKNPYKKFSPKQVKTERTVLTQQEVAQLEQLVFPKDEFYLELIRDMFLFSCYTGLRFADVRSVKRENIEEDEQGYLLKIIAKKTNKQLILPLYKLYGEKTTKVINKYVFKSMTPNTPIFHEYANQYYNRILKVLGKRANIHKQLTSHVARHTFATHLASKVPIHILKSLLQHSKLDTTMVYLHLSNKIINDALDKIDW
ncbi:site-specific integrase [Aureispira anguillae]|uniref:Site-specific integrase n=1 Tax=Aureispira anguillae TaxID=2864201 RepID=A0A915YFU1_9BACT|nr:site-specific integrase [Aureispira anguillae]BDS12359.1 site-specific integrase [Aureispira anguillae]